MPSSQNEIEVSNLPPTPAPITGTVTALQGGAWSVAINNYPAVQPVSQFGAWNINAIQSGAWNVNATQSGAWAVAINNFPATQPVSGTVTANQGTSPWASNIRVVPTDANSMYADCIYTDNDKVFSVSAQINQVTGGANNPLLLLRNPAGSGKRMYVRILSYGIPVANVLGIVNLYANPTITANGGAISPVNHNIGSGTASVILASTLPTIAANGSLLRTATFGQNSISIVENLEGRISVPANNSLLITGNPASNNRVAGLTIVWIEL